MKITVGVGLFILGIITGLFAPKFFPGSSVNLSALEIPFSDTSMAFSGKKILAWQPISPTEATTWKKNYLDESENLWYPLKTDDDEILRGFYIDKRLTDALYAASASIDGFRVYLGQRPGQAKRSYCLIFASTTSSTLTPRGHPTDYGTYFDYVDPCPKNCPD